MGSLEGRIAVVTGASRGIGRGTAIALGEQGAVVYVTGRTTGEGLVRAGKAYQTRPKLIFVKPLQADFRRLLCADQLKGRSEP